MSYLKVRSANTTSSSDVNNAVNQDGYQIDYKLFSGSSFNLSRSFFKIDMSIVDNNGNAYFYQDPLAINEHPQHAIFRQIEMTIDGISYKSSPYYYNQMFTTDLLTPQRYNMKGINSKVNCVVDETNIGTVQTKVGSLATDDLEGSSNDFIDDANHTGLLGNQYTKFGERMSPFPIGKDFGVPDNTVTQSISAIRNNKVLARNKKQFLIGHKSVDANSNSTVNVTTYIMQPLINDIFQSDREDYITNNIDIRLTRGKNTSVVQFPSNDNYATNTNYPFKKGVVIILNNIDFFVYMYNTIIKNPRSYVWASDLRNFPLDTPNFNRVLLMEGRYDYVVMSIIRNEALGGNSNRFHPCQSGTLFTQIINNSTPQRTDGFYVHIIALAPNFPEALLKEAQFTTTYNDGSIKRDPETYRYEFYKNELNGKRISSDFSLAYLNYLEACGIDPFNSNDTNVAKVDFMNFQSQLFYMPFSCRRDGMYKSPDVQEFVRVGVELDFEQEGFASDKYNLILVGFFKIFL